MADEGEVLDYVDRKGPITIDAIVRECGIWSPDEVYRALKSLEDDGFVTGQEGSLKEHGTTKRVWFITPDHPVE